MPEQTLHVNKLVVENALRWFHSSFRDRLVTPIEGEFPNWPLARELQDVLSGTERIAQIVQKNTTDEVSLAELLRSLSAETPNLAPFFSRVILGYRRYRAAITESHVDKTFHTELTAMVENELKLLDALSQEPSFAEIEPLRIPRLSDFLAIQYVESASLSTSPLKKGNRLLFRSQGGKIRFS